MEQVLKNGMNILFSLPDITELEIAEVAEALRSGWITTGPRTKEFEKRIAEHVGINRYVSGFPDRMCGNGVVCCGKPGITVEN